MCVLNSSRKICAGHVEREFKVLVRKREGKRPFGIPRRIWKDNIKTDLQEIEYRRGRALD
jgi:hypothetical protein